MKTTACVLSAAAGAVLVEGIFPSRSLAVESIHFGYIDAQAPMTNAIRQSTRTGTNFWSANKQRTNAEDGSNVPYSYHDGYVENSFLISGVTHTADQAAQRWKSIMTGNGDPWTGVSGAQIGTPSIIILDELNSGFSDGGDGTLLRNALDLYINTYGGSRNDIAAFLSPSFSQSTATVRSNYDDFVYSATNQLRSVQLELYAVETGYNSGGETYLATQLGAPIRRWTTTWGVPASRITPTLQICNFADNSSADFAQFLNRQFHFTANGWYNAAHTGVDANIQTAIRNGASSYTWTNGTGNYQLVETETMRDAYFEEFTYWYSVLGNTAMDNLWKADANGTFSTGANWLTGAATGGIDSYAKFLFPITQPRTISVNSAVTVGHLIFDNDNAYTIAGASALTMQISTGTADVTVTRGSHTISAPLNLNNSTTFAITPAGSTLTVSGQITALAGATISKTGAGTLRMKNLRSTGLNISGGVVEVMSNGTSAGAGKISNLTISGGAKLDLQDNHLAVVTTPLGTWNGTAYTGLSGLIAAGQNGGTWDGAGIITGQPDALTGLTTLGIAKAADVLGIDPGQTATWAGQTVAGANSLIMYTYAGDANLDGFIDGTDYFFIDSNVATPGAYGYINGDFNYDGAIDGTDYFFIDSNIVLQGAPFTTSSEGALGVVSVPEPGGLIMAILAAGLVRRR